jgi:Tol biopolymer transport system component
VSRTSHAIATGAFTLRQASLLTLAGLLAACGDRTSPSSPTLAQAKSPDKPASIFIPGIVPKQIAFGAHTVDAGLQVFRVNPDGTGLVQVSDWLDSSMPTWSPGRTRIAFSRMVAGNRTIRVMGIDGTLITQLGDGYYPRWSPDSTRIAFQRHPNGGPPQVFVMNANGSAVQQLTNHPQGALLASWSPDSKKIVFAAPPESAGSAGELEIWAMNDNGSNQHQVTSCTANGIKCTSPDWHPVAGDNRIVYSVSPFGSSMSQVRTIRANGTDDTVLRNVPGFTFTKFPVWSPDGARIAYFDKSPHAAEPDIYTMNEDGTGAKRVTYMPSQAKSGIDW